MLGTDLAVRAILAVALKYGRNMMKKSVCVLLAVLAISSLSAQDYYLQDYSGFWHVKEGLFLPDLFAIEDDELPYLRNEIFARYGRPFTTDKYRNYFIAQSWYREVPDYQDSWIPAIERENSTLMMNLEKSATTREAFVQAILRNISYDNPESGAVLMIGGRDSAAYFPEGMPYAYGGYAEYYIQERMMSSVVWGDWLILYAEVLGAKTGKKYTVICLRLNHDTAHIVEEQRVEVSAATFDEFLKRRSR